MVEIARGIRGGGNAAGILVLRPRHTPTGHLRRERRLPGRAVRGKPSRHGAARYPVLCRGAARRARGRGARNALHHGSRSPRADAFAGTFPARARAPGGDAIGAAPAIARIGRAGAAPADDIRLRARMREAARFRRVGAHDESRGPEDDRGGFPRADRRAAPLSVDRSRAARGLRRAHRSNLPWRNGVAGVPHHGPQGRHAVAGNPRRTLARRGRRGTRATRHHARDHRAQEGRRRAAREREQLPHALRAGH